uniref:Venom S1 protease with CUB domain 11 n=1 Tax=Platymeris rhadamanthus TaxID=1134088 RepID=A0A6B9L6R4_PLARH|nr:venom S1 protease with CUB domain 11 [Platymeris rhadamanthus]
MGARSKAYGFLYLFFGIICSSKTQNVDILLEGDRSVEVNSPNYPNYASSANMRWNLFSKDPKAKIQLTCGDFRLINTSPCQDYVSIDTGGEIKKLCGTHSGITVISEGQSMVVQLYVGLGSSCALNCEARLLLPIIPTEVTLHLRDPAYLLHTPKDNRPHTDRRWIFRTVPGIRLALTCNDFRYSLTNPCKNGMEVSDGQQTHIFCGSQSGLQIFSVGQEIKVKLFTGIYGGGTAKCIVQAVNGPSNLQFENEVSQEIDSSEHGTKPGIKSTTCKCGWTNKAAGRIAHGKETGINEYPWMVAIRESLKPGDKPPPFHFCGGSILTHYHVLSAAHCVYYRMDEELYAVLGEHNIRTTTETDATQHIKIVKKIIPDDYNYPDQYHDIALLVLEKSIIFNERVGPICLSPKKFNLAYKHILLTGWGLTQTFRPSDILMKAYLRVLDLNVCGDLWGYGFNIDEDAHKVCTDSRKRDSCSGDSGGPLVTLDPETNRYTQVSLVSFGAGCNVGKPSVSTEIAPFYDWILKVIKDTYPQEMVCNKLE